jgi:hypothetical protein
MQDVVTFLATPYFGACWAAAEMRSPVLQSARVALKDLSQETARAKKIRDQSK